MLSSKTSLSAHGCSVQTIRHRKLQLLVRAQDALCKDKVSLKKEAFKSEGKVFKIGLAGAGGEVVEIDCPDDSYILDAADKAGLDLPATCRGGICGACVARVAKGEVDASDIDDITFTLNEDEIAQGMALLCMTRAKSDLVLETQCDWGYSLGITDWKGASGRFTASPDPLMGKKWND